jgi:Mn-dependent DtxR family transcriptional regulator
MKNGKQASLEDVREELRASNRLKILSLVLGGIQQKDIAATLGVSNSLVSQMFPKGLLKRVGLLSKSTSTRVED